jgi:phosphoribosyl 1,2-cyclic phosphodiesterase
MLNLVSLFSSSKGNCTYVYSDSTKILVDIGVSTKRLVESLNSINVNPEEIQGILITHEHSDHIKGIKVFCKKYNVPVFASKKTWSTLVSLEINNSLKNEFEPSNKFSIGDIDILPFSIPHDAIDPCGFNLLCKNEKVTVATDIGHITPTLLSTFENSNAILLESNHDVNMLRAGKYPYLLQQRIIGNYGHLSNITSAETVEYLIKKGTKKFILAHLSEDNNMPSLALETVKSRLLTNHIDLNGISIEVAKP